MNIGALRVRLGLPENGSLKGKRKVIKSISTRVGNKFNVSVAEVDDLDHWKLATLGVVCVSNDGRHANEMLSKIADYIETIRGDAEVLDYEIEIINAF
ncbi:MAG: DUF503 domain-containing protein [Chloroflexi bacterium]|jgi:uncharacterized protein|nr:DUF503 domain-containing protein [Chloroflexota bacterium]